MTGLPTAPADLLADGWEPLRPGAFITMAGPFFMRTVDGHRQFCFRVEPKHDNTQGRPHGGAIMTFLDEAMGLTTQLSRPQEDFFTIGFDCQFMDGSVVGDLIVARTEVVRATRSLMFMRGECHVGGRIIAAASGIWKAHRTRA